MAKKEAIERIKSSVDEFFSDTRRSVKDTHADLEDLKEHIEMKLEALEADDAFEKE